MEISNQMGAKDGSATTAGGSSGGGSINIFYTNNVEVGNIQTNGGEIAKGSKSKGGAGGNGSISVGQIVDETYVSTYTNY